MASQHEDVADEGVLDPWVADWMAANPERATAFDFVAAPEILELARGPVGFPPTREIASITDEVVEGVPVRIYQGAGTPTGLVVYFHGGGYVMGSIGLMDNVARELAHGSRRSRCLGRVPPRAGTSVPRGPRRLRTGDALGVRERGPLRGATDSVAVSGESAGGNLAAAVALRLQDAADVSLAGQVLIYPQLSGTATYPSAEEFDGLVINRDVGAKYWAAYSGGRDLDDDPFAVPLSAANLRGLPPALVVLAGCDMLRDEGRAYADRLRDADVDVDEVCYPGQPHGFVNFEFPAAAPAFERIGTWLRARL